MKQEDFVLSRLLVGHFGFGGKMTVCVSDVRQRSSEVISPTTLRANAAPHLAEISGSLDRATCVEFAAEDQVSQRQRKSKVNYGAASFEVQK